MARNVFMQKLNKMPVEEFLLWIRTYEGAEVGNMARAILSENPHYLDSDGYVPETRVCEVRESAWRASPEASQCIKLHPLTGLVGVQDGVPFSCFYEWLKRHDGCIGVVAGSVVIATSPDRYVNQTYPDLVMHTHEIREKANELLRNEIYHPLLWDILLDTKQRTPSRLVN